MSFEGPIRSDTAASALAQARSALIDAFAELELEVSLCCARVGATVAKDLSFGKRLNTLAETKPNPHLSKQASATLKELVAASRPSLHVRSAVVHSTMRVCACGDPIIAIFRNVADIAGKTERTALIFSAGDLEARRETVRQLSARFAEISPRSPPAPPCGGAS
jgi:hypothetical protein